MKPNERDIVKLLAETHNIFATLDHYNSNDMREWLSHLHAMQNIVLARTAIRQNGDLFVRSE